MAEMIPFVIFLIVALIGFQLWRARSEGGGSDAGPWPFYAKRALSDPELILMRRLIATLPGNLILAQVALGRLLGVKKGHNFGQWFNRINRMSVDFVVCDQTGAIVTIIELDDSTHTRADRKVADAKKDKALEAAGVRVIRWQAKSLPDEQRIKMTFAPPLPLGAGDLTVRRDLTTPTI